MSSADRGAAPTPPFVRTPDDRFVGLPGYDFAPHYVSWRGLRIHYVDEGPPDGPVALLLHGEPTWSYLYRKMIPRLVSAGFRCIAPDFIGFGRSDKVIADDWYVIERHCESLRAVIEALDLRGVTLFVQDWGGPIGLRQAVDMPERFARLVILNTWLHSPDYAYSDVNYMWREVATNPLWLAWVKGAFPCGAMAAMGVGGALDFQALAQRAAGQASPESEALERAYEAPFLPGGESRAGPRRFPWLLPFAEPEAGNAEDQARCYEALKRWEKPAHFIFGGADGAFTADWGRRWAGQIPGATFDLVPDAGHFLQEDAPDETCEIFLRRAGLAADVRS